MPRTRLPLALRVALSLSLVAVFVTLPGAVDAVTDVLPAAEHRLEVSGDMTVAAGGLLPGDRGPVQTIHLRATGAIRYRVGVTWAGSAVLANALELSLTRPDGSVMYRGPLAGATVGGTNWPAVEDPRLGDGEEATILAVVSLPLSAGNEIQGQALQGSIRVESYEDAAR